MPLYRPVGKGNFPFRRNCSITIIEGTKISFSGYRQQKNNIEDILKCEVAWLMFGEIGDTESDCLVICYDTVLCEFYGLS